MPDYLTNQAPYALADSVEIIDPIKKSTVDQRLLEEIQIIEKEISNFYQDYKIKDICSAISTFGSLEHLEYLVKDIFAEPLSTIVKSSSTPYAKSVSLYPYNVDAKHLKTASQIVDKLLMLGKVENYNDRLVVINSRLADPVNNFPEQGVIGSQTSAEFKGPAVFDMRNWIYFYERIDYSGKEHKRELESGVKVGDIISLYDTAWPRPFETQDNTRDWIKNEISLFQNTYNTIGKLFYNTYKESMDYIDAINDFPQKIPEDSTSISNTYDLLREARSILFSYEKCVPSTYDEKNNVITLGLGSRMGLNVFTDEFLKINIQGGETGISELGILPNEIVSIIDWLVSRNIDPNYPNIAELTQDYFDILLQSFSDQQLTSFKITREEILTHSYRSTLIFSSLDRSSAKFQQFTTFVNGILDYTINIGGLYERGNNIMASGLVISNRKLSGTSLPESGFARMMNNWVAKLYGVKSVEFLDRNTVSHWTNGDRHLNIFQYTLILLHTQELIDFLFDGDSIAHLEWQKEVCTNGFANLPRFSSTSSYDFISIQPNQFTYDIAWEFFSNPVDLNDNLALTQSSLNNLPPDKDKLPKLSLLVNPLTDQFQLIAHTKYELQATISELNRDAEGGYFFDKDISRYRIMGENFLRSIGMTAKSKLWIINSKGEKNYFFFDAVSQVYGADDGFTISLWELLDKKTSEYIYDMHEEEKIAFLRCIPLTEFSRCKGDYLYHLTSDAGMGKIFPLQEYLNKFIVDDICKRGDLLYLSRKEILRTLPLHYEEWISDAYIAECECIFPDWATMDQKKEILATKIANQYGFFLKEGEWQLTTGFIETFELDARGRPTGNIIRKYVDMRFYWYFAEHILQPDVKLGSIQDYQKWFKENMGAFISFLETMHSLAFNEEILDVMGNIMQTKQHSLFSLYQEYIPTLRGTTFKENYNQFFPWMYWIIIRLHAM